VTVARSGDSCWMRCWSDLMIAASAGVVFMRCSLWPALLGVPAVRRYQGLEQREKISQATRHRAATGDNSSYGVTIHQGLMPLAVPDYESGRHGCTVSRATHSTRRDGPAPSHDSGAIPQTLVTTEAQGMLFPAEGDS
jgi:hypothetical protein